MAEARELQEIKQRLALIETRLEQVFEKLDMAPRAAAEGGGWWGGSEDDGAAEIVGNADSDPEVLRLIADGKSIAAIKRYRELTGLGLAEAKQAVERLGG